MQKLLKDLYFGNIVPAERQTTPSSNLQRVLEIVSQSEKRLRSQLNEAEQPLIDQLVKAQNEVDSIMACENFILGVRLGVRLMRSAWMRTMATRKRSWNGTYPMPELSNRRKRYDMILKAVISNKTHPGYGQDTIPFPIPDSEYDHTIGLLEGMGIGSPTAQDCRVDELDGPYPILNRLVSQSVNVDELDHLAKRLASFCQGEDTQFEAMASKLCLSDIKDFINLTFCCQQATVITDFSTLERVGKEHILTVNGGSMPSDEYDKVDGRAVALDLIQNGAGVVTPYGVVYDNGMKLEQVYDGRHFPAYLYETPQMMIKIKSGPKGETSGFPYFPCPHKQIQRTLERAGAAQRASRWRSSWASCPRRCPLRSAPPVMALMISTLCAGSLSRWTRNSGKSWMRWFNWRSLNTPARYVSWPRTWTDSTLYLSRPTQTRTA